MNGELEKLKRLQEKYQQLRNEKLATDIVIHTLMGDFEVSNPHIVTAVLDFLIHEISEIIKQEIKE